MALAAPSEGSVASANRRVPVPMEAVILVTQNQG